MKQKYLILLAAITMMLGLVSSASAFYYETNVLAKNNIEGGKFSVFDTDPSPVVKTPLNVVSGQTYTIAVIPNPGFAVALYNSIDDIDNGLAPVASGALRPDGSATNGNPLLNAATFTLAGDTRKLGLLVGRVGNTGTVFNIGNGISYTAATSGELQLFMWGGKTGSPVNSLGGTYYQDNCFTPVKVSISATPIPGAAWLLGSGIIGLIGLKRKKNRV